MFPRFLLWIGFPTSNKMIFYNRGAYHLCRMRECKPDKSPSGYAPFTGYAFQSYGNIENPTYSFCASQWPLDYVPMKSLVIPTNLSCTQLSGKMYFSRPTGRLYILGGVIGLDATCYVLHCPKNIWNAGEVQNLKFSALEPAPKGFKFELKNPMYDFFSQQYEMFSKK